MPGFGILKKLTGRKTLGRRRSMRVQNNEEEEDEFMGFGIIDSLVTTRFELTDTTGIAGSRWMKGESMIGKFMNKAPETWPPEPKEDLGRRRQPMERQRDLDDVRNRRLQEGREILPESARDQIALDEQPNLLMI